MNVTQSRLHCIDLKTRIPFRFGITTLTRVKHAFLSLDVCFGTRTICGVSSDHLFPKWFKKDPEQSFEDEVAEQIAVIRQAVALAEEIDSPTVFTFWKTLYQRQLAWADERGMEPLLALFGVTLVERALIDALAKYEGCTVADLILNNRLGIDFSDAAPAYAVLGNTAPADWLPATPLNRIKARHTVGFTDPLFSDSIPPEQRVTDGLPQALETCIAAYGLSQFKIKVCGDLDTDLPRLRQLSGIITRLAPPNFVFSLDGNEQFKTCAAFRDFWFAVVADPELKAFFAHALFIEQPLNRKVALSDEVATIRTWDDLPPIIIDESDATLESTPRALDLGYAGTSHKNCKGVIRGILNRCLIEWHQRQDSEQAHRFVMSGEDLVNIGPVALLQDLCIQAILGNESVERNGHHYFAGLSAFPESVQQRVMEAHGDVFGLTEQGWPSLRIEDGSLDMTSILRAPFALGFDLPYEDFEAIPLKIPTVAS